MTKSEILEWCKKEHSRNKLMSYDPVIEDKHKEYLRDRAAKFAATAKLIEDKS